jgi:hypothetical protein
MEQSLISIAALKNRQQLVDHRIKALDLERKELTDEHNALIALISIYGHRSYDPVNETAKLTPPPDLIPNTTPIATYQLPTKEPKKYNPQRPPAEWRKEILETMIALGSATTHEVVTITGSTYGTISKHVTWLVGYNFLDKLPSNKYRVNKKGRTLLEFNCNHAEFLKEQHKQNGSN